MTDISSTERGDVLDPAVKQAQEFGLNRFV
jgi:hypothetical protein